MKGINGDPNNSGIAINPVNDINTKVPSGWPGQVVFAPAGGPPGAPIQYGDSITNNTVEPGFGYLGNGNVEENLRYFFHSDHLGSTSYITNAKGEITQFVGYMPFGEAFVEQHTDYDSPFKFNGKEMDSETGLCYYGVRYFDPKTARFINCDPIIEKFPELTPYNYASNNPSTNVDLWGLQGANALEYAFSGMGHQVEGALDLASYKISSWWDSWSLSKPSKATKPVTSASNGNLKNLAKNTTSIGAIANAKRIMKLNSSTAKRGKTSSSFTGIKSISDAGLNFIIGYEGFSATLYKDVAGYETIGYGHLIKSGESFGTLTRDAAQLLLKEDASFAGDAVNNYVNVNLSQCQFDALASFTFNVGADAFSKSSLLKNVNLENSLSIEKSFLKWNKAKINGVLTPLEGLTNRRKSEANIFLNGDYKKL
jgi:RHS repeat-associated protein